MESASSSSSTSPSPSLWVFGYGSLCWNPGFQYSDCRIGYIRGYVRRFWQGNTTHRGTEDRPGRVATLVAAQQGITYGCAFKVAGQEALDYLQHRECSLGGYVVDTTKFYPHLAEEESDSAQGDTSGDTFPVLLYIATEDSCHWQGEATLDALATQICECRGPSGHNVEYVLRLAQFIRARIPDVVDGHLFELERLIHEQLAKRRIDVSTVMGSSSGSATIAAVGRRTSQRREASFEFRSRVPSRKLRCIQI